MKAEKELAAKVEELESQLASSKENSLSAETKLNSLKEKLVQETERSSQVFSFFSIIKANERERGV